MRQRLWRNIKNVRLFVVYVWSLWRRGLVGWGALWRIAPFGRKWVQSIYVGHVVVFWGFVLKHFEGFGDVSWHGYVDIA